MFAQVWDVLVLVLKVFRWQTLENTAGDKMILLSLCFLSFSALKRLIVQPRRTSLLNGKTKGIVTMPCPFSSFFPGGGGLVCVCVLLLCLGTHT